MTRTLAIVLLTAAGCTFNYKNPAEDLRAGEVGGRAVVAAVPKSGVAVSVKGSTLSQGTRQTGVFLMLPLPTGNHTLLLRSGRGGLVVRDVEVTYGRDGQPEGVWVGDVAVPGEQSATTVQGSVTGAGSGGFVNGVVIDGVSGQTIDFAGASFQLDGLFQGDHPLWFAAYDFGAGIWKVGGPVLVKITSSDAGTVKTLTPVVLHPPATPDITGRIKVRLAGIGTSVSGYAISGIPGSPAPDSNGLIDASIPEGLYTLTVTGPGGPVQLPPMTSAVVTEGQVMDVGTLYVASLEAVDAVNLACSADADCAPGVCASGSCTNAYTPPTIAPPSYPLCGPYLQACYLGSWCSPQYASTAQYCMDAGSGLAVCLADGACCSVDGTTLVCGTAPVG
ncbi:MAG TPA: hypothetical protein VF875_06865 [Anaeromyxobacter sp.]